MGRVYGNGERQQQGAIQRHEGEGGLHERCRVYGEAGVERYRARVGVLSSWSIAVSIFCQDERPAHEGYCTWDDELWQAEIGLCCALSAAGLEWVLVHELCELQSYREGDWVADLLESLPPAAFSQQRQQQRLLREFQRVRNQSIEERVQLLLGQRRPQRLHGT